MIINDTIKTQSGLVYRKDSMVGGAKQFVTPLNGETLRKIGVLIERK